MSHAPIHTDIFFFEEPNLAEKNCSSKRALTVYVKICLRRFLYKFSEYNTIIIILNLEFINWAILSISVLACIRSQ